MNGRCRGLVSLAMLLMMLGGCAGTPTRGSVATALDAAIEGAHRPASDRARDRFRHPRETLLFFGLRPNETVVEITPTGGWYTRIIAPVLSFTAEEAWPLLAPRLHRDEGGTIFTQTWHRFPGVERWAELDAPDTSALVAKWTRVRAVRAERL